MMQGIITDPIHAIMVAGWESFKNSPDREGIGGTYCTRPG